MIALFLLAASLVVFGSGKFFQKTDKYVLYFDESLKGLSVGAPVLFKGIQVGSVTGTPIIVVRHGQDKVSHTRTGGGLDIERER